MPSIICNCVIPSRNETDVYPDRAILICAIMEGLPIDVSKLIVIHMQEVVIKGTMSLLFPFLITHLF